MNKSFINSNKRIKSGTHRINHLKQNISNSNIIDYKQFFSNRNKVNSKSKEVVVGIDFGSSGSGFAYSFFNENNIIHGNIFGANVDNKVPTEIILDDNLNTLKFGADCIQYMKENPNKTGHYFKGIKMHLYQKKTVIQSKNTGKVFSLKIVIQKILEQIKKLAIEEVRKNRSSLDESQFKWVVTVPAIWEEFEKSIMMSACIGAGLIDENTDKSLFFALEPEAASIYCSRNKEIDPKCVEKGKLYIVCDLGGGTGDIVTHLVGENKSLKEIESACGGNFGSNEIDKRFFKEIIYRLFGFEDFNSFYKRYKLSKIKDKETEETLFGEWNELEREIKDFKEGTNLINQNIQLIYLSFKNYTRKI